MPLFGGLCILGGNDVFGSWILGIVTGFDFGELFLDLGLMNEVLLDLVV